jgi:glycosyltransferase involved in cell wall biosynthesis
MKRPMKQTLISVVIPAFNSEGTLAETLESVLQQTHRELEVLVVDDGSTDGTAKIAEQFARRDRRCRCIRQDNGGQPQAMNRGIENAHGEYISFLDADDLYGAGKLENQLEVLHRTGRDVALTQIQRFAIVDAQRVTLGLTVPPAWEEKEKYFRTILFLGSFQMALFTTAMIRRHVLTQSGLFDPSLPTAKDWDLWLRLASGGCTFVNVQKPLYFYRKHPGSLSLRLGLGKTLATELRILEKLRRSPLVSASLLRKAKARRYIEHLTFLTRRDLGLGLNLALRGCWDARIFMDRKFYPAAIRMLRD